MKLSKKGKIKVTHGASTNVADTLMLTQNRLNVERRRKNKVLNKHALFALNSMDKTLLQKKHLTRESKLTSNFS